MEIFISYCFGNSLFIVTFATKKRFAYTLSYNKRYFCHNRFQSNVLLLTTLEDNKNDNMDN